VICLCVVYVRVVCEVGHLNISKIAINGHIWWNHCTMNYILYSVVQHLIGFFTYFSKGHTLIPLLSKTILENVVNYTFKLVIYLDYNLLAAFVILHTKSLHGTLFALFVIVCCNILERPYNNNSYTDIYIQHTLEQLCSNCAAIVQQLCSNCAEMFNCKL